MKCSCSGSSVLGILQARILEGVVILSTRGIFLNQELIPCLLPLLQSQAALQELMQEKIKVSYMKTLHAGYSVEYPIIYIYIYIHLFVTPRTIAHQAPLSLGFFRQEYWSGLPFPSPGDLPEPGIKPRSPPLQANSLPLSHQGSPLFPLLNIFIFGTIS